MKQPLRVIPVPGRGAEDVVVDESGMVWTGTEEGIVRDIDADATGYHMVTGVREHAGALWLGSLVEPAVAVVDAG